MDPPTDRVPDISGKRFGGLTVLHRVDNEGRLAAWMVKCDCGVSKVMLGINLRRRARSCGCLRSAASKERTKHGDAVGRKVTREYSAWTHLHSRCSDPNNPSWARYGGRGIAVCARWSEPDGFANFLSDMGRKPSAAHSVDRYPDQDGNYEPGNCRWATVKEQANNRSSNRRIAHAGECLTIAEWSDRTGIKASTITMRIDRGWSTDRSLTQPVAA